MLLIFSPSCLSLWKHIGGRKAFQTPYHVFDDWVGAGPLFQVAKLNSSLVRSDISRCVFGINHEKSNWEPSRRVSWTGYNIDTHTGLIFASDTGIL